MRFSVCLCVHVRVCVHTCGGQMLITLVLGDRGTESLSCFISHEVN